MKALDRKLLRDLRLMWSQALTIALVVASGIGGFITTLSAVDSLALARDRFYAQGRFADVFAGVKRAPNALADTLRATPGVADVQATIEQMVRIELDGVSDPIIGMLIGVDLRTPPAMNRVTLKSGRALDEARLSGDTIPALVSPGLAEKRALRPGSKVGALINGKQRTLEITGIALSPEYIFAGLMGMPDLRGVGASNGVEAIECIERQPYDVVLMDVQMPEMDGLEASRRITAKWQAGERPRIVAMTANAMQGDREECLAAGMDDYVTKPIRVDALVEALLRAKVRHAS